MDADAAPLPEKTTTAGIEKGEVDLPEILEEFITNMICRQTGTKERQIKLICQETVFSATTGRKRPKKHLQFELAIKSLTGNRQIMELLNRLGHCISYHVVTEIKTEMIFEARNRCQYTPYGMELVETVSTMGQL